MTAEGVEVTGFDNKKTGAQTLKVTYGGQETSFDITIQAKSVQEVKLLSAPTQTTVKEGKKLDLAGAKVQVVYDNGTTDDVDVTEDMISGLDTATPGTYDVTVTYNNKKADTKFKITVEPKKVSAVQLNTSTLVTEVKEGKTYTPAGKLTVSYDNDTTEVVSFSDASVTVDSSAVDTATPGEYTVKVSYTNGETYTLTYTVKVVDKILTGISVTTNPKTSYIEGNALDLSEGVITLSYDNDTTATLAMTAEGVVVSGYDNTKVGSQTLKVTYGTQETALDVVVAAKQISNVEIISYPLATTVLEALEFDVTGGKLKVSYDNDTTEEIAVTQAMLKLDTNKVGEQEAQIEYAGRTFGFNVTVIPKSPISITAAIPSDEIVEGTELADAGLNVFLNYDNGTSDNLVLSTVGITGYDNNTLGSQTVKLSYVVDEETTFETELIVYVLKGSDTDLSIETNDTDQNKYVVSNQTVTEEVKTIVKELVTTVISTVKNYDVVDFTMYIKETGAVTQPDGTVAVTISIAKVLPNFNTANKVSVYRLDDDKLVLM
jgi:hypothetical protein